LPWRERIETLAVLDQDNEEATMAVGLIMRFSDIGSDKYDAIMEELGLPFGDTGDWPEGIISHAAGSTPDGGWTVVDVWESQEAFDRFFASRLGSAFDKVGGMPQPDMTSFQVHNTYRHGQRA
jgi:hypothetical protein